MIIEDQRYGHLGADEKTGDEYVEVKRRPRDGGLGTEIWGTDMENRVTGVMRCSAGWRWCDV